MVAATAARAGPAGLYRVYVLAIMTMVYMLNLTDRVLIAILLEPIKHDLQLSDTQLGFLSGIAFGLFYAVLGIPIARWADRGNRASIASLAIGLWGLTVMASVFVASFVQMALARVAAAVGEAGCKPPTYSLVGDYFPLPAERTRAMSIYWLGGPLSAVLGFVAGGWLNEVYGWRMTFLIMGIPGLVLALVIRFTIREPRKAVVTPAQAPLPLAQVLSVLWRRRAARRLGMAIVFLFTLSLGLSPWYASFLARSHEMGTRELGLWLGLLYGAGGAIGTLLGGYVATRWFAGNERGQMRLCAVMILSVLPCYVLFLLVPSKAGALASFLPVAMLLNTFVAPSYALLQRLVADEMRATTLAVVMLFANLIGIGLGPQLVGLFSDLLQPAFGIDSLRYAMLAISALAICASYFFWKSGDTIEADLAIVAAGDRALRGRVDVRVPA